MGKAITNAAAHRKSWCIFVLHPNSIGPQELSLWTKDWLHSAVTFLHSCSFLWQRWLVVFRKRGHLDTSLFSLCVKDGSRVASIGAVDAISIEQNRRDC